MEFSLFKKKKNVKTETSGEETDEILYFEN